MGRRPVRQGDRAHVQEAEDMREADAKKRDGVTVKNDAETLCYQVEKQLSELKDKMSTADADDLKKKMEDVRQTMAADGADPEDIQKKTKDLQEASWKVTQQAYQSSADESTDSSSKDSDNKENEEGKKEKEEDKKEKK